MVNDNDSNELKASPQEIFSDEQRARQENDPKPLLNGVWADKLSNGQDLVVGGSFIDRNAQIMLNLDFDTFDANLTSITSENLRSKFDQNKSNIEEWLKTVEQSTGRKIVVDAYLFYCLQQIQGVVLSLLDHDPQNPSSGFERNLAYQEPKPKLSELKGKSHCAEIAALGQYILQKAGINSAYVGGVAMNNPYDQDEYAEAHSFIVIKDDNGKGQYIFDIARPGQHNLPTLLNPKVGFDYDLIKGEKEKLIEAEEILLGEKRYFGVGEQVAGRHNVLKNNE